MGQTLSNSARAPSSSVIVRPDEAVAGAGRSVRQSISVCGARYCYDEDDSRGLLHGSAGNAAA
jgi:hypothetical protein